MPLLSNILDFTVKKICSELNKTVTCLIPRAVKKTQILVFNNPSKSIFLSNFTVFNLKLFLDDGSVMRTCAPIGIDDCKKANSVNYCYCSKDGCNTPDRRLSQPEGWAESKPRHGHELDLSAPRIQATDRLTDKKHSPVPVNQPPTDDEDAEEGSGGDDWGSFYYDSYYDTLYDKNLGGGLNYDTEPGFGDPDNADMTEPPPFIEQELEEELEKISRISNHKYDRELEKELENEIILVEETIPVVPRGSGADIRHIQSLLLLFPLLRYLLS